MATFYAQVRRLEARKKPQRFPADPGTILVEAAACADDRAVLRRLGARLEDIGLFDRCWYLKQYSDVAAANLEPLTHFLDKGILEGRDPNALFHGLRTCGMAGLRAAFCRCIAERGCDPITYYNRLGLAYRDFAIVCYGRSGSHLLATAMNSHSQIHCQGELLQILREPHKPYASFCEVAAGTVNGAIIMYGQWRLAAALRIISPKLIHLTRDPRKTALSCIRNDEHLVMHGARHNPHASRNSSRAPERDYPVDEAYLAALTAQVRRAQREFGSLLPEPRLEVTYEELCANRDVHAINDKTADRISCFLQLTRGEKMITPLQKTSSSYCAQLT